MKDQTQQQFWDHQLICWIKAIIWSGLKIQRQDLWENWKREPLLIVKSNNFWLRRKDLTPKISSLIQLIQIWTSILGEIEIKTTTADR